MRRAVIYIQPGSVPRHRQIVYCLDLCSSRDLLVVGIVPDVAPGDAVQLVVDGDADVIVSAHAGRPQVGGLRELARDADVPVEYYRPPALPHADLIRGMYERSGHDVDLLARLLGEDVRMVRRTLGLPP